MTAHTTTRDRAGADFLMWLIAPPFWVSVAIGLGFLLLNVPRTFQFPMFSLLLAICAMTLFYSIRGGVGGPLTAVLLLWYVVIPPWGFVPMTTGAAAWLCSFFAVALLTVWLV